MAIRDDIPLGADARTLEAPQPASRRAEMLPPRMPRSRGGKPSGDSTSAQDSFRADTNKDVAMDRMLSESSEEDIDRSSGDKIACGDLEKEAQVGAEPSAANLKISRALTTRMLLFHDGRGGF